VFACFSIGFFQIVQIFLLVLLVELVELVELVLLVNLQVDYPLVKLTSRFNKWILTCKKCAFCQSLGRLILCCERVQGTYGVHAVAAAQGHSKQYG
jgi:hypothetical protein